MRWKYKIGLIALLGVLIVFMRLEGLHAQTLTTTIPADFERYDLFEYDLSDDWLYLPGSAGLSAGEAVSLIGTSIQPPVDSTMAGWWIIHLKNASSLHDFSLRFMLSYSQLEFVKLTQNSVLGKGEIGFDIQSQDSRVMGRLLSTSLHIEPGSEMTFLVRSRSEGIVPPRATLNSLKAVEDYSQSFEKLSLIFTAIFLCILLYQLVVLTIIKSRSLVYYSLLALGYLLHAFNYQLDGWISLAMADDISIISATVICLSGASLWQWFLKIHEGIWLWIFNVIKYLGFSIIALVLAYMTLPSIIPRLNAFASLSAAALAVSVIALWTISSLVISKHRLENTKIYMLTNVPIMLGGLLFIVIWLFEQYGWVPSISNIALLTNYIFYCCAVVQLLLFTMVIGFTLKKRVVVGYKNEKTQKEQLEHHVKERTVELEQMNEALSQKNRELEKSNGIKNRLLTILSHDLRTPINNVASLMTLLHERHLSPEEFSSLILELEKSVSDTTNFMSLLIRWTHSQNDGLVPRKSRFNIESLVNKSLGLLRPAIQSKKLEISTTYQTTECLADENMIELVIRNLLSNAIKFSESDKVIEITASKGQSNAVEISIIDHGVGIDQCRFDKFFDVTQKNTTLGTLGEKGFGMGLILCKDFVELNGGQLAFTSEKGKGSTFTVTIPS